FEKLSRAKLGETEAKDFIHQLQTIEPSIKPLPFSRKPTTFSEFEQAVDQVVRTAQRGTNNTVGKHVEWKATNLQTNKSETVILDNFVWDVTKPNQGGKIIDAKWSDTGLVGASPTALRGTLTDGQKPVFAWIADVQAGRLKPSDLKIVPVGPNAKTA